MYLQLLFHYIAALFTTKWLMFYIGVLVGGMLAVAHPWFADAMQRVSEFWVLFFDQVL